MGGLVKRKVWTGIYAVPPLVALIIWGPPFVLSLMIFLATLLGLREFYHLTLPQSKGGVRMMGIGLGLLVSIAISYGSAEIVYPLLAFLLLILFVLFMGTSEDLLSATSSAGVAFLGIFYIGFLLSHVSLIRQLTNGTRWVLFLIATVWAGDIFAFLCGSLFGKHKLYPKISPNKTYEGLAGAILGSALAALVFTSLFIPGSGRGFSILLGVSMGILGQFGDFTESMLKRSAQVKDSGSLIPGHGGMLDRLDSFLFSAPFLYYSLLYLLKEAR